MARKRFTVVQIFLLAGSVAAGIWGGSGRDDEAKGV
jgi:hypothetical protein